MGIIKDFINNLFGDCETCKHKENCPFIEEGRGSCFEVGGGFEPHYEKKEEIKNKPKDKIEIDDEFWIFYDNLHK